MSDRIIASRRFTMADQELFARLSGDVNPMHLDALAARKTQAGAPVAHGMHAFLWTLERLAEAGVPMSSLAVAKVQFNKFIYLDRPVTVKLLRQEVGIVKAELVVDRLPVMSQSLRFGDRQTADQPAFSQDMPDVTPDGRVPDAPSFETMATLAGWLRWSVPPAEFRQLFPRIGAQLGDERVAALAHLSTLVGMICPGFHSIFSGFSIGLVESATARPGIGFKAIRTDDRFRLVVMTVAGPGLVGEVSTFARSEPVAAPSMTSISSFVAPDEFAGRTALIVGGSRGLGAITAKLLAAGGGRVIITYVNGRDDAHALVDEIATARGDTQACRAIPFDAGKAADAQLDSLPSEITHLYYFATPKIFRQNAEPFSPSLFGEFADIYARGFYDTCRSLLSRKQSGKLFALYPSTIAITDRPKGLTEYVMAKAAGELLCDDLKRHHANLSILAPRLPRVRTDQTATVPPIDSADPLRLMLPLVRAQSLRSTEAGLQPRAARGF